MNEERISPIAGSFIVAVAVFVDVLQTLLGFIFLGWAVTIIAAPSFFLWLTFHSASPFQVGGKSRKVAMRAVLASATALIELIPWWGVLNLFAAGWTLYMAATVVMIRWEDQEARREQKGKGIENASAALLRRRMRRRQRAEEEFNPDLVPVAE